MTPTTPDPADGDATKAREIVLNFTYSSAEAVLDVIEHDGEVWIKLITAALHQARKDGARVQMERDCAVLCSRCRLDDAVQIGKDGLHVHYVVSMGRTAICDAAAIRAAWESEK